MKYPQTGLYGPGLLGSRCGTQCCDCHKTRRSRRVQLEFVSTGKAAPIAPLVQKQHILRSSGHVRPRGRHIRIGRAEE